MKRRLISLLTVLTALGCSGSQPGPGSEDDTLRNEAAFCSAWAKAACNEDVVSVCNGTRPNCIEQQTQVCQALVPPGYKSKNAESCVEAVRDAYEDAQLTAEELEVVLRLGGDCTGLVDGGQDEGGDCLESEDCDTVNGFECVIRPGDAVGTCQVPEEVGGGYSCVDPEVVCAAGFYCDGTDCLRRRVEDAACTSDGVCAVELRCEIATGETEGTCVPRLANREPCMTDEECVSGICLGPTDVDKICVSSILLTVQDPLCRDLG